jgi:hypothetical protein
MQLRVGGIVKLTVREAKWGGRVGREGHFEVIFPPQVGRQRLRTG